MYCAPCGCLQRSRSHLDARIASISCHCAVADRSQASAGVFCVIPTKRSEHRVTAVILTKRATRADGRILGQRGASARRALCVILTKRASRADGRISDSFALAKPVPVSENRAAAQIPIGCSDAEPEPAALAPRCPEARSQLHLLAMLASSG